MAEISLRSYLGQIESAVAEGCFDEALVHCRRILEQYPQHLETYRLLGAALLKGGEYEDAVDVFQRVLGADPEDAVAHRGLAIAYGAIGRLLEAGWHRDRAAEIQPYAETVWSGSSAPAERDNEAGPQRPALNRAALARIHVRGGLYPQAIAFLSSAIASSTSRPDLQAMHAEALWRDGRRIEAVKASREILNHLPNCVTANAILAESLLATDHVDEAQVYLARVQAALLLERKDLLEDSLPAVAFNARGAFPLDEQVMVQALDLRRAPAKRVDAPDSTWTARMGISSAETFVEPVALLSDEPDWLPAFQARVAGDGDAAVSQPAPTIEHTLDIHDAQAAPPGMPAGDEISPDAGRVDMRLQMAAGVAGAVIHKASLAEQQPEPIAEEPTMSGNEGSADSHANEEPDERKATLAWLEALAARQGVSMDELSAPGEPPQADDATEPYPDWLTKDLNDVPTGADVAPPPSTEAGADDDIPDWLRDSADIPVSATPPAATDDEALDDLGWLDQIAAGAGEPIDEPPTLSWQRSGSGGAEDDEALSWLDGLVEPSRVVAAGAAVTAAARHDDEPLDERESELVAAGLEQSAASRDTPSEELPGADSPATETAFEPAIPEWEEAEAAMMPSLDDVPDDLEAAQIMLGAAFVGEYALGEGAGDREGEVAVQPATALAADVPEDPVEVLDWLERLAAQQIAERGIPDATERIQVVEEPITPAVPLEVVAAAAAAEALVGREEPEAVQVETEIESVESLIASIPDDPDAAMAWLELLAARQVAAREESPVVEEQPAEPAELKASPEPDDGPAVLPAAALLAMAEPTDFQEEGWPVDVEQEVADSMPDWLALEPAQPTDQLPSDPTTAWEADQADFSAWLAGEETAGAAEPLLASDSLGEEIAPAVTTGETEAAAAPDRAALIAGYERELSRGENIEGVLQGLEAMLADSPEPDHATTRLLGDAYAQAGNYTRALETYGEALDML